MMEWIELEELLVFRYLEFDWNFSWIKFDWRLLVKLEFCFIIFSFEIVVKRKREKHGNT